MNNLYRKETRPFDIYNSYNETQNYYVIKDMRKNQPIEFPNKISQHGRGDDDMQAMMTENDAIKAIIYHIWFQDCNSHMSMTDYQNLYGNPTQVFINSVLKFAPCYNIVHYTSRAIMSDIVDFEQFERQGTTKILGRLNVLLRVRRLLRSKKISEFSKPLAGSSFSASRINMILGDTPEKVLRNLIDENKKAWLIGLKHDGDIKSWRTMNRSGVTRKNFRKLQQASWYQFRSFFSTHESDVNLLRLTSKNSEVEIIEITDILKQFDNWNLI